MGSLYRRHRFPPEIISHAVWLYHRFTLSFRDVEDLLAERGITVSLDTGLPIVVEHSAQPLAALDRSGLIRACHSERTRKSESKDFSLQNPHLGLL